MHSIFLYFERVNFEIHVMRQMFAHLNHSELEDLRERKNNSIAKLSK